MNSYSDWLTTENVPMSLISSNNALLYFTNNCAVNDRPHGSELL